MGLKAKVEAIIYAAEEPVTLDQIAVLMSDAVLAEDPGPQQVPDAPVAESEAAPPAGDDAAAELPQTVEPVAAEAAPPDDAANAAQAPPAEPPSEDALPSAETPRVETAPARRVRPGKEAVKKDPAQQARIKARVRALVEELISDYARDERGLEIRQVAGGFRMATKPEHHDVVRAFARGLKPPLRLSIAALETLAVIAYKQPVTIPEISEIRGVEAAGVIGTLLERKLITTAGRKQVIGRPILYKTSKEFLLRFGLNDLSELPSMEEFEKLALDGQVELFTPTPAEATAPPAEDAANSAPSDTASAEEPSHPEALAPSPAAEPSPDEPSAAESEPTAETPTASDTPDEP
jgi:segregation and condensation protein B